MVLLFAFATQSSQDKFEYIFQKYRRLMLHKAYGILGDFMLAEDAASEALIRVYKNLHKIEDPDSPATAAFVVTITKNAALTMRAREQLSATVLLPEEAEAPVRLEEEVLDRLSVQEIYRLVDGLGEELGGVFLMKYAYEMTHSEIAAALGLTENNVAVRLHRGRKRLGELLREEDRSHG